MPAGRNQVDYTDIDYDALTVKADNSTITYDATKANGSAQVGLAVTWSADDTVALTADADFVLGKLIKVENTGGVLWAVVQNDGMMTLPAGASATVTRGTPIVGALGPSSARGYIRNAASGTAAELVKMNGHIVNVADTTNVVVDLD
jgi:hypothetical protein